MQGETFQVDPTKCVCQSWKNESSPAGHHGQCRYRKDGQLVVGKTPPQALEELGPPKPTLPPAA
jgi:hypothetical protein